MKDCPWQDHRKPYIDARRELEQSVSPTDPHFRELDRQLKAQYGVESDNFERGNRDE